MTKKRAKTKTRSFLTCWCEKETKRHERQTETCTHQLWRSGHDTLRDSSVLQRKNHSCKREMDTVTCKKHAVILLANDGMFLIERSVCFSDTVYMCVCVYLKVLLLCPSSCESGRCCPGEQLSVWMMNTEMCVWEIRLVMLQHVLILSTPLTHLCSCISLCVPSPQLNRYLKKKCNVH